MDAYYLHLRQPVIRAAGKVRRTNAISLLALVALVLISSRGMPAPVSQGQERTEIWVELSEPALGSLDAGAGADAERAALSMRIIAEQDRVLAELKSLGGMERGRVRTLRNAVAVAIPRDRFNAILAIPGVRAIRIVRHVNLDPPEPGH